MRIWIAAALLFAQAFDGAAAAQQPGAVTIRTGTQEVLLDFVVRDGKGRFVRGLKPEDVEVFEDGVKQSLRSFRLVEVAQQRAAEQKASRSERPAAATQAVPETGAARSVPDFRLVSIVFDRINDTGNRQFAARAAREFLTAELTPNTYAAVFVLDVKLCVLQPFTNNRDLLAAAVDKAASGAYPQFRLVSDQVQLQLKSNVSKGGASGSTLGGGAPAIGGLTGSSAAQAAIADFGLRMRERPGATFTMPAAAEVGGSSPFLQLLAKVYEFEGRTFPASTDRTNLHSLVSLVREQAAMPGRKALLLLSEGMRVPSDFRYMLRSTISEANRANVTFYAIDARGLMRSSTTLEGRNELAAATAGSAAMLANPLHNDFRVFEQAEASLTANSRSVLRELAESTGGFLVADTNDVRDPVRRIMEEVRTQYVASYVPANAQLDGRFRKIEVRLRRPGLRVQSRNGYFAVPAIAGHTVFPHEVAMLSAIQASPQPRPFDFRAEAIQFRPGAELSQCLVVFDMPRRELTLTDDKASKVYKTRVSFLALVRDESGGVVEKITRDIPLHVPLDRREAFEAGRFVFTTPFAVPAGRLSVDFAVLDGEGRRVSVRRSEFRVEARSALMVSRPLLARRVEELDVNPDPGDPLQYDARIVSPTLSAAWPSRPSADLSLFFVIYPDPSKGNPEVKIEFWRDGRPAWKTESTVAVAPEVPYLGRFQTSDFEPGTYEAVVTVTQAGASVRRTAEFTIVR